MAVFHRLHPGPTLDKGALLANKRLDVLFAISEHATIATEAVVQVQILPKAVKELKGLNPEDRTRIVQKIQQYAADPAAEVNNVKHLQGSSLYRLRVGDYRVLFSIEQDTIIVMLVHRVRHRREAYD